MASKYESGIIEGIDRHWREHHCPPTVRKIMEAAGVPSSSVVVRVLESLCANNGYKYTKGNHASVVPPWVQRAIDEASR